MGTYNDLDGYRKALAKRHGLIRVAVTAVVNDRADKVADAAKKLLSGTASKEDLADHPFARRNRTLVRLKVSSRAKRRGVVPRPLLPINRHTWRLYNSVRVVRTANGIAVIFDEGRAPYWKHVLNPLGTVSTVPRGFQKALAQQLKLQGLSGSAGNRRQSLKDLHRIIVAIYRST